MAMPFFFFFWSFLPLGDHGGNSRPRFQRLPHRPPPLSLSLSNHRHQRMNVERSDAGGNVITPPKVSRTYSFPAIIKTPTPAPTALQETQHCEFTPHAWEQKNVQPHSSPNHLPISASLVALTLAVASYVVVIFSHFPHCCFSSLYPASHGPSSFMNALFAWPFPSPSPISSQSCACPEAEYESELATVHRAVFATPAVWRSTPAYHGHHHPSRRQWRQHELQQRKHPRQRWGARTAAATAAAAAGVNQRGQHRRRPTPTATGAPVSRL